MCTQFDDADEVTPKGNPKPPTQGILAYMNSAKISEQKKIKIEWLIFCMFICCALPWALMDNKFFAEFILALAPNFPFPTDPLFFQNILCRKLQCGMRSGIFGGNIAQHNFTWQMEYLQKGWNLYSIHNDAKPTVFLYRQSCFQRCIHHSRCS